MATSVSLDRIPPSTASYVIAAAIIAGVTGFFIGQGAAIGLFSSSAAKARLGNRRPRSSDAKVQSADEDEDDWESEEEDEEDDAGELATFEGNTDEVKLVLVVRTDLGMTKGAYYCSLFVCCC